MKNTAARDEYIGEEYKLLSSSGPLLNFGLYTGEVSMLFLEAILLETEIRI